MFDWDALLNSDSFFKIIASLIILVILFFVIRFINKRKEQSLKIARYKKSTTNYSIIKIIVTVFAAITVLAINDVDVSSLITGLGVASVVVAFALEEYLKDIVMGLLIKSGQFYAVGDVIDFDGNPAIVKSISLRATIVQLISTGDRYVICNRNINKVKVLSDVVNINVPMPMDLPPEKARALMEEICTDLRNNHVGITGASFKGTQEIEDYAIIYRIKINCEAWNRDQHRRDAVSTIQDFVTKRGITFPRKQMDVYEYNMNAKFEL